MSSRLDGRTARSMLALVLLSLSGHRAGAETAAEALLASASLFGKAPRIRAELVLEIAEGGDARSRGVELFIERDANSFRSLASLTSPAFLAGLKFLKIQERGKPDAQWLRTSRGVRKLDEADRSERIFGSHFTAEDFASLDTAAFELSFDEARSTGDIRAIRAVPKDRAGYAVRIMLVDTGLDLVVGFVDLDAAGRELRRYRLLETTGEGAAARPVKASIEDLATGGVTTLRVMAFETPSSIPSRHFNPATL